MHVARVELPLPKYFVIYASICTVDYASLIPLSNRGFRRCASMRIIFFHHQLNVYHGIFLYHEQIRLRTHDKLQSRAPYAHVKSPGSAPLNPSNLEERTEILCRIRMPGVYYYI